ncbi:hypothetical protein PR048_007316 [Dryococelus australis]|uniref:Uncharacterized protein n=1 Tax=Dryococelus australis TaxID=614101 RepID=A0ABQ9IDV1_9NEOP|nr:hypothetical protein PR048_007316 [Dryococelus australis]
MHELFVQEYHINVPYKAYWLVFKTFSVHFGFPWSDTCNLCDSMEQKMNAADTQEESQNFTSKESRCILCCKNKYTLRAKQGSIHLLSFDYMHNLPLPHITGWQLWYNIFGVHNLGDDSAKL